MDESKALWPGRTISESTIREAIVQRASGHKGRIITTQFASNIHRLYGVKAAADATGMAATHLPFSPQPDPFWSLKPPDVSHHSYYH